MTIDIIPKEFQPEQWESLDEDSLYEMILSRVNELLETDVDLLLSYLYRLDVEEHKITNALSMNAILPANEGIARLILERQKQRMITKKKFKQDPIKGWEF
ncbi:MAG: hypothetical protein HKN68_16015 [Saprospiraceae bacterium]|nr:hypothetical protein [Saprospiraceae bacterium]